jgi:hypothetical protein
MYFWTLNLNMFPESLYNPHLLLCIVLCDRTRLRTCLSLEVCGMKCGNDITSQFSPFILVWPTVLCRLLARAQCVIVSEVRSVCSTINMRRKCISSSDAFCYICGEVTFKSRKRSFTPLIKKCYEHYFGCKVGDQDKSLAPYFCFMTCVRRLATWENISRSMLFAIPMVGEGPRTMF